MRINQSGGAWLVSYACSVDKISSAMWTVWIGWIFSFVDCGYWMKRRVVFICFIIYSKKASQQHGTVSFTATAKETERREYEIFVFASWVNKKKRTVHLYSLLSLFKLNDYCLHCSSKCSCYLPSQFDPVWRTTSISMLQWGSLLQLIIVEYDITPQKTLQSVHACDLLYCCISFSLI